MPTYYETCLRRALILATVAKEGPDSLDSSKRATSLGEAHNLFEQGLSEYPSPFPDNIVYQKDERGIPERIIKKRGIPYEPNEVRQFALDLRDQTNLDRLEAQLRTDAPREETVSGIQWAIQYMDLNGRSIDDPLMKRAIDMLN